MPASITVQRPLAHSSHAINAILETLDSDIQHIASRNVPHNIVPPEILSLEIDELAQETRIKLWLALQKGRIENPGAYARCIVHSGVVDRVRKHKKVFFVNIADYDDLYQAGFISVPAQDLQDPADMYEHKELTIALATKIAQGLSSLPPRQQYAMLCHLKDSIAEVPWLVELFLHFNLDFTTVHWPSDAHERQTLYVSRSIARRKLRTYLKDL